MGLSLTRSVYNKEKNSITIMDKNAEEIKISLHSVDGSSNVRLVIDAPEKYRIARDELLR